LASFADFCCFCICYKELDQYGLTINLSLNYLGVAKDGDFVVGRGRIVKATKNLIFVDGDIINETNNFEKIATFTSVIKNVHRARL
jgi:acyl-coenzyme A thioesterase PaaI-like protein